MIERSHVRRNSTRQCSAPGCKEQTEKWFERFCKKHSAQQQNEKIYDEPNVVPRSNPVSVEERQQQ